MFQEINNVFWLTKIVLSKHREQNVSRVLNMFLYNFYIRRYWAVLTCILNFFQKKKKRKRYCK